MVRLLTSWKEERGFSLLWQGGRGRELHIMIGSRVEQYQEGVSASHNSQGYASSDLLLLTRAPPSVVPSPPNSLQVLNYQWIKSHSLVTS
jgi:hypothetical protein